VKEGEGKGTLKTSAGGERPAQTRHRIRAPTIRPPLSATAKRRGKRSKKGSCKKPRKKLTIWVSTTGEQDGISAMDIIKDELNPNVGREQGRKEIKNREKFFIILTQGTTLPFQTEGPTAEMKRKKESVRTHTPSTSNLRRKGKRDRGRKIRKFGKSITHKGEGEYLTSEKK